MRITRRATLFAAAASMLAASGFEAASEPLTPTPGRRRYHVCLSTATLIADPELLTILKEAAIDQVWLPGFFYGAWPFPIEELKTCKGRLEKAGIGCGIVNIPLGHPGDSIGSPGIPLTPPADRWKQATNSAGAQFWGQSIHAPAVQENAAAAKGLAEAGFTQMFLDDDFRLAQSPGVIGGCYCDDHRKRFLIGGGYADAKWKELLDDVAHRSNSPLLKAWLSFHGDELTGAFRAIQKNAPGLQLGPMVMYLGSEKAGIRLTDYRGAPMRVGEFMFDDNSFGSVKGKTDELFSALFHRRFVEPNLAYSETTSYPANALSALNMAAKLNVSTIADVRNTMMMTGVSPFEKSHWQTLAPAMKASARIHEVVANHVPRGPFKHFWGDQSRCVGDDRPFSLFLASGVPFEVTDESSFAPDGFTFLSDFDARSVVDGALKPTGGHLVSRGAIDTKISNTHVIDESAAALAAFKAQISDQLDCPFVEGAEQIVAAWYPSARSMLLWNVEEHKVAVSLRIGGRRREINLDALDMQLVSDVTT